MKFGSFIQKNGVFYTAGGLKARGWNEEQIDKFVPLAVGEALADSAGNKSPIWERSDVEKAETLLGIQPIEI